MFDVKNFELGGALTVTPAPKERPSDSIEPVKPGASEESPQTPEQPVSPQTGGIDLSVTSPQDGATIEGPDVIVTGTVTNPLEVETGVTVNGIPAMVHGTEFVANHVPLSEEGTILSVTATDVFGNMATTRSVVYRASGGALITVTATPSSGIAPFESVVSVRGTTPATETFLDYTGPADIEVVGTPQDDDYTVRIREPGLYSFTGGMITTSGRTYRDTVVVQALDRDQIDRLLQSKWNELKSALIMSDLDAAVSQHHPVSQERYRAIYELLREHLPGQVEQMRPIGLVSVSDNLAKYRIRRTHIIRGQPVELTYYIYFSKDANGLWKIERY